MSEGEYMHTHIQVWLTTHHCHSFTKPCDFMSQRLKPIDRNNKAPLVYFSTVMPSTKIIFVRYIWIELG